MEASKLDTSRIGPERFEVCPETGKIKQNKKNEENKWRVVDEGAKVIL